MELTQLQYFIQTAHEMHFARAASMLGVTQPTLSRGIQSLEKELGVMLFQRFNKWHVELTAAGKIFLPEAEKALRQLKYAEEKAIEASEGRCGKLTIGAISSTLANTAFIETLNKIRRKQPGLSVEIIDSKSNELAKLIQEKTLDIAFLRSSPELDEDEELHIKKIYDDQLSVALPLRHPLAKKKKLKVSDLTKEKFIMVPLRTSSTFRNYIYGFCASCGGFSPITSCEISSSYTALSLVEAEMGITIVSSAYERVFEKRVAFRQFSDFQAVLPIFAVYSADNYSAQLKTFLAFLEKELSNK